MSFRFPKSNRLLKAREYQRLSKNSHLFHGKALFIVWQQNGLSRVRLGITVSRKNGDSVNRNRFKRVVREAFRLTCPKSGLSIDLHIRPQKKEGGNFPPSFQEVADDFIAFFTSYCKR